MTERSIPEVRPISPLFGESPQLHLRKILRLWSGRPAAAVEAAAAAIESYLGDISLLDQEAERAPASALERLQDRLALRQEIAREALDPLLGAGLQVRLGRYIVPWLMPTAAAATDWLLWHQMQLLLIYLGTDGKTRHLCVCESCSIVFKPSRRKKSVRTCEMCASGRKRRLKAPALGMPGTLLRSPGDRARVRVPMLDGLEVRGIREVTLGLCVECGEPFDGPAGKQVCSDACWQRQNRRI